MKLCVVGQTGNRINRIITEVLRVLLMIMMDGKNAYNFSATTRVIPKRQRQYIPSIRE
jgi:hypothetical protein